MHPVLSSYKNAFNYLLAWALLSVVHTFALWQLYDFSWQINLADSLATNMVFMLFGIAVWFPIQYINIENKSVPGLITEHLAVAFMLVAVWHYTSSSLLKWRYTDEVYLAFLKQIMGWRLLIGLLMYFILVLSYYLAIYYEHLKEKIAGEAKLEALVKEAELNYLKAQINPHFLFNSLNSIHSLTGSAPDKASEMVVKLAEYLRYSLAAGKQEIITFGGEMENIYAYLDIEKVRFGDKLNFTNRISEDCKDMKMPALILQPLIENAIKHGVSESLKPTDIWFVCHCADNYLQIEITNTYEPNSPKKKGVGHGLKSVRNRLILNYDRDDLLRVTKENNKFKIRLHIPQP